MIGQEANQEEEKYFSSTLRLSIYQDHSHLERNLTTGPVRTISCVR
jgi:hypothetical protein